MKRTILIGLLVFFATAALLATPPDKFIGYSGFIARDDDSPVGNLCQFEFSIYDAEENGNMLWEEWYKGLDEDKVDVTDGEFTVSLGSKNGFAYTGVGSFNAGVMSDPNGTPDNHADDVWVSDPSNSEVDFTSNNQYWLQVKFLEDGQPKYVTFSPRKMLNFVPYSFQTENGEFLITSAGTSGQVWKSDGSGAGYWGTDIDTNLTDAQVDTFAFNSNSPTVIQVMTQAEEDLMTPVNGQIWLVE